MCKNDFQESAQPLEEFTRILWHRGVGPEVIYCGRNLSNSGADTVEEKQVLKGSQTEASLENSLIIKYVKV